MEGFLCYKFGGADIWRGLYMEGLFSEFYGTYNNLNKNSDHDDGYKIHFCPSFTVRKKIQDI